MRARLLVESYTAWEGAIEMEGQVGMCSQADCLLRGSSVLKLKIRADGLPKTSCILYPIHDVAESHLLERGGRLYTSAAGSTPGPPISRDRTHWEVVLMSNPPSVVFSRRIDGLRITAHRSVCRGLS